jgi:hypothetical protein
LKYLERRFGLSTLASVNHQFDTSTPGTNNAAANGGASGPPASHAMRWLNLVISMKPSTSHKTRIIILRCRLSNGSVGDIDNGRRIEKLRFIVCIIPEEPFDVNEFIGRIEQVLIGPGQLI